MMIRLALYQPDIAQNTGTLTRLCACLGVPLDIIEPSGFDASDRNFRRAGMDYTERATITRHASWGAFAEWRKLEAQQTSRHGRLVLAETDGATCYTDFAFEDGDIILLGRESAGVPPHIYEAAEASVNIPQLEGLRSINVAVAGAMILGEALRQTDGFPRVSPFKSQNTVA